MSNSDYHDNVRKRLLRDNPPDEVGVWKIRGEDSNCDLGGSHHMPELATVQGRYRDVVEYALNLKDFFQWGGGGDIKKVSPQKVKVIPLGFSVIPLKELKEKRARLADELALLDEKIANGGLDPQ